jgi:opacity protein-like surface antigen
MINLSLSHPGVIMVLTMNINVFKLVRPIKQIRIYSITQTEGRSMKRHAKLLLAGLIVLGVANLSFAQADIGFKGIGGKIGLVGPEGGIDNAIGFGALVDLGSVTDMIELGAFLEYWSKSVGGVDFNALTIAAMVYYHFPMEGSSLSPYVGAGLGFSRTEAGVRNIIGPFGGSVSNTDLSISLAGGVDTALSPKATGRAEFKYNLDGIDYWSISVGVIFKLGD